jgi:hypothetical protein
MSFLLDLKERTRADRALFRPNAGLGILQQAEQQAKTGDSRRLVVFP